MARSERSLNFGSDGKGGMAFKNIVLSRRQLRLPNLMGSAECENHRELIMNTQGVLSYQKQF